MLDSALSILDRYIDTTEVSRFTFYSVEMERGENPEDLYYLCFIGNRCFVALETDYIDSLSFAASESTAIFENYGVAPLHWIVKKDSQSSAGTSTLAVDAGGLDDFRESLIFKRDDSYLRYVVIEFASTEERRRFDPNVYGFTTATS